MLRSAFSVKSLERYFLLLAVAVLVPVSILTGMLLMHNWKAFSSAREAQRGFDIVRATLQAMERVSAERGPMNAAFGFDYPVPASALERVRSLYETAEKQLEGRDWLAGFRSFADPYFYMTLRWAERLGVDLSGLPNIAAFKARMEADDGVQRALKAEGLA